VSNAATSLHTLCGKVYPDLDAGCNPRLVLAALDRPNDGCCDSTIPLTVSYTAGSSSWHWTDHTAILPVAAPGAVLLLSKVKFLPYFHVCEWFIGLCFKNKIDLVHAAVLLPCCWSERLTRSYIVDSGWHEQNENNAHKAEVLATPSVRAAPIWRAAVWHFFARERDLTTLFR
jgi:hypothetical protein